jgi:alpha-glucosidase
MVDYYLSDLSQFRDPPAVRLYQAEVADGTPPEIALAMAARMSRDRGRTPMQWADAPNAGFSPPGVETWLPVNPDFRAPPAGRAANVATQAGDPASMLSFYRQMLSLRRATPALMAGDYQPLNETAVDYLAFLRRSPAAGETYLVVLNYSERAVTVNLEAAAPQARCLFSTTAGHGATQDLATLTIAPFGIYIGGLSRE